MIRYLWAALLLLVSVTAASAQGSAVNIQCLTGSTPPWANCSGSSPFPVTIIGGGASIGSVAQGTVPWAVNGQINVTLTDCSGSIAAGATAQNAFAAAATRRGFTVANIDTSEVLWISFTTTAAASGTGSYPLAPATATSFDGLASFTSPLGMGTNTALSVIAATTSHKYSCTVW